MDWYNGFSPQERSAMGRAAEPAWARQPPCSMCGDPSPLKMQLHAEDYSVPYCWQPPAAYPVCTRCHRRIHSRFDAPARWHSYLGFLRRGWYGREVSSDELNRQARMAGSYEWRPLPHEPPVRLGPTAWWWESLTVDRASLLSPSARAKRQGKRTAMTDFRQILEDAAKISSALESVQPTATQLEDLRQLYAAAQGLPTTRDKSNRVRGDTAYSCSMVGAALTRYFDGIGPGDKMMWLGHIKLASDGKEMWVMRPEIRSAMERLNWV